MSTNKLGKIKLIFKNNGYDLKIYNYLIIKYRKVSKAAPPSATVSSS